MPELRPWQDVEGASGYAAKLRRQANQTPPMGIDHDGPDNITIQEDVAKTRSAEARVGKARL